MRLTHTNTHGFINIKFFLSKKTFSDFGILRTYQHIQLGNYVLMLFEQLETYGDEKKESSEQFAENMNACRKTVCR